ncbi:MAG: hypothetical protein IJO46_08170 [Thermoguttaceae bacterium]|nr:hypothetical protein [Thermoguttaceae bacterium]
MPSALFFSASLPRATDDRFPLDRFPNATVFAPVFTGRATPATLAEASTDPNAAFFSDFAPSLKDAARRLTAPTADVIFDRFEFATLDELARRFDRSDAGASRSILFAAEREVRFLIVAPSLTFRLLFAASLGFDVAALCENEALWNNFNADARLPWTAFEEKTFAAEAVPFSALSPFAFLRASLDRSASNAPFDAWRPVAFPPTPSRAALELDDVLFYLETRSIRLASRVFPWTVVFSTRRLAALVDGAPRRETSPTFSPPLSAPAAPSASTFELSVVVERGEMPT